MAQIKLQADGLNLADTFAFSGTVTGAGGGTSWQSVVTGSTMTAVAGNGYPINTTSNACTVTLPAGSVGDTVELVDYAGTWDTNAVTLTANGSEKIEGATTDVVADAEREGIRLVYVDATQGWIVATAANEGTSAVATEYDKDFLVIAGGGQGSDQHGGGGGAGVYRNSYNSETSGRGSSSETAFKALKNTVYTITVGGGGGGAGHPGSANDGADGSDSSIAGSNITTITSTGGGGGAGHGDGGATGENGGCGGGSGLTGVGGDGVAAQGYDGGDNQGTGYSSWPNCGSGGGGAGAAGGDGDANADGNDNGWGGTGLASSITGSSVVRGGGGGGGSHDPHTPATGSDNLGAAGGGGNGGLGNSGSPDATNGVDGKGGGGGGSNGQTRPCGDGGDGVIILRMATVDYSGTTTGSPAVTTDGSDTILNFTGSGSYTG